MIVAFGCARCHPLRANRHTRKIDQASLFVKSWLRCLYVVLSGFSRIQITRNRNHEAILLLRSRSKTAKKSRKLFDNDDNTLKSCTSSSNQYCALLDTEYNKERPAPSVISHPQSWASTYLFACTTTPKPDRGPALRLCSIMSHLLTCAASGRVS